MTESLEFGIGTRRRPVGRDYAAAKDTEVGKKGLWISDFGFIKNRDIPKSEVSNPFFRILPSKFKHFCPLTYKFWHFPPDVL